MEKEKQNNRKKIKAVMTVEASLILPIFLMLFMNLLSMIEVYRIHSNVAQTLWEEGRKTAKYLYLKDTAGEYLSASTEVNVSQLSALLASLSSHKQIVNNLRNYPVWEKVVNNGESGFLVLGEAEENGVISIDCKYQIHPLFQALTPISKEIENHYYGHAWIGYVLSEHVEEQEETYVYITETGTVYHKNRGCSYLNPSIRSALADSLESLRNQGGAIYYACPLCIHMGARETYYITNYGTNYHSSINCSGLKRTIYEVKLSEVGEMGSCNKCGG